MAEIYQSSRTREDSYLEKKLQSQNDARFVDRVKELLKDEHGNLYEDFLHQWNLYKQGHISKHDLYCEIVVPFSQVHQDFLVELRKFLGA